SDGASSSAACPVDGAAAGDSMPDAGRVPGLGGPMNDAARSAALQPGYSGSVRGPGRAGTSALPRPAMIVASRGSGPISAGCAGPSAGTAPGCAPEDACETAEPRPVPSPGSRPLPPGSNPGSPGVEEADALSGVCTGCEVSSSVCDSGSACDAPSGAEAAGVSAAGADLAGVAVPVASGLAALLAAVNALGPVSRNAEARSPIEPENASMTIMTTSSSVIMSR